MKTAKDFGVPGIHAKVIEISKYFHKNHFAEASVKKSGRNQSNSAYKTCNGTQ